MHCNDDCLILWHGNNTATNLAIWHGTNGANIQLGWVPRMLTNVSVDSVDIVHNLMGWADDKGERKRLRCVQFSLRLSRACLGNPSLKSCLC